MFSVDEFIILWINWEIKLPQYLVTSYIQYERSFVLGLNRKTKVLHTLLYFILHKSKSISR